MEKLKSRIGTEGEATTQTPPPSSVPSRTITLVCPECGTKFSDSSTYTSHLLLNHKRFTCDSCEKCYPSLLLLLRHKSEKHPSTAQTMHPGSDGDTTTNRATFAGGPSIALGDSLNESYPGDAKNGSVGAEGTFRCGVCDAVLSSKDHLTKHFQVAHGALAENFSRCSDCDAYFLSKDAVKTHRKKEHGAESPNKAESKGSSFSAGDQAKYRDTSVVQQFSCSLCSFKFQSRKSLKLHLANVHKGRRVKCFECDTYFTDHSGLKGALFINFILPP